MIDIDPDIEKQISLIQEEKLNSKIKEDIKKVVKVVEKPEEKLVDFFSIIASEKKQTKEKIIKSEKKIADIEELFSSLTKEKKKTKPKKELLLEPEKPKEEIKEEEQTVSEVLQDELEPIETDENVIGKVTKKLSEMKVANELDKDKLRALDKITSLDEMKKEFVKFREVVTKQMGSIGGGGEVNLAKLDDVDTASALVDKRVLQYDGATGKFIGTTLETEDLVLNGTDASGSNAGDRLVMDGTDSSSSNAGDGIDLQDGTFGGTVDLSRVDQDIVPDTTNSRNLGSATNRWNRLFLAGETIDLAGATISSDGTGAIAIAATGATLPAGSKAGDNELAVLQATTGGAAQQLAKLVPFFTNTGGLNTKNTDFEFNGTIDTRLVFTGSKSFTLGDGSALQDTDVTIFQF